MKTLANSPRHTSRHTAAGDLLHTHRMVLAYPLCCPHVADRCKPTSKPVDIMWRTLHLAISYRCNPNDAQTKTSAKQSTYPVQSCSKQEATNKKECWDQDSYYHCPTFHVAPYAGCIHTGQLFHGISRADCCIPHLSPCNKAW